MTAVAKARAFPRANAANRCSIPRPAAARIHLGEINFGAPAIPTLSTSDPVVGAETAIALLADIDARYERERDALDKWSGSERAKKRMLERLRLTVERSVSGLWNGHFNFENCCNASRGSPVTKARPSIKELVSRLPGLPAN